MFTRQLTFVILLLACACSPMPASLPDGWGAAPAADPASLTYRSSWRGSGEVTLTNGIFREPAAPGSAGELVVRLSDRQAFGVVAEEEIGAVILVTDPGGSGTFYDLALLVREEGVWVNCDVFPLGDRVVIHALAIRDGSIVVDLTGHGTQDPLCCPTQRMERRFTVRDGRLTAVVDPAAAALAGPAWQWVRTLYNDDSEAVPPRPEEYTVMFAADGTVSVRADCNQKGGTFLLKDKALTVSITHSTMAMCPEGSLEDRFVRDLAGAAIWFIRDGDLYLDLKYDTGTMHFRRPH